MKPCALVPLIFNIRLQGAMARNGKQHRPIRMHRPIGRYRRSKHRKSLTFLNITRHLLYVYFRLRAAQCAEVAKNRIGG